MRRRIRSALGVALSASMIVGQVGAECTMRFGFTEKSFDFNPVTSHTSTQSVLIARHMGLTLMSDLTSGLREFRGAASFDVASDTKTITISLNPTCHWSDGAPITSADYVEAIQYVMSLNVFSPPPGIAKQGDAWDIQAPDDRTIKIGYIGSSETLLTYLGTPSVLPIPTHLGLTAEAYYNQALADRVVSGPYRVIEQAEDELRLAANPHYCDGALPSIDQVTIKSFATDEERVRALVAGELDLVRHVPSRQMQAIRDRREDLNLSFIPIGNIGFSSMLLNPTIPGLDNPDVREALSLALDYPAFIHSDELQLATTRSPSRSFVVPVGEVVNPYVDPADVVASDVARARSLMEAAGYSADTPLSLTITTYPLTDYEATARQIASMLRRIHVDLTFEPSPDVPTALETGYGGQHQTFVDGSVASLFDLAFGVSLIGERQLPAMLEVAQAEGREISPEIVALHDALKRRLDEINSTDDPEARADLIYQAEILVGESHILLPLYQVRRNLIVQPGFEPNPDGWPLFVGFQAEYWTNTNCEAG